MNPAMQMRMDCIKLSMQLNPKADTKEVVEKAMALYKVVYNEWPTRFPEKNQKVKSKSKSNNIRKEAPKTTGTQKESFAEIPIDICKKKFLTDREWAMHRSAMLNMHHQHIKNIGDLTSWADAFETYLKSLGFRERRIDHYVSQFHTWLQDQKLYENPDELK